MRQDRAIKVGSHRDLPHDCSSADRVRESVCDAGSFAAAPPAVPALVDAFVAWCLHRLEAAAASAGDPALSFFVLLRGWDESQARSRLNAPLARVPCATARAPFSLLLPFLCFDSCARVSVH